MTCKEFHRLRCNGTNTTAAERASWFRHAMTCPACHAFMLVRYMTSKQDPEVKARAVAQRMKDEQDPEYMEVAYGWQPPEPHKQARIS
jgi:hypothetical protein